MSKRCAFLNRLILVLLVVLGATSQRSLIAEATQDAEIKNLQYTLQWRNVSNYKVGGSVWSTDLLRRCDNNLTELTDLLGETCNSNGDKVRGVINSLSPCELEAFVSCILSVEVSQDGGSWAPANYAHEIRRPEFDWKSSINNDLSKAFVGGVYTTQSGELLAVKAVYAVGFNEKETSVEVVTVVKEKVDWSIHGDYQKCLSDSVFVGLDECLVQVPSEKSVRVVLDLRWKPSGWVHTQMDKASVRMSQVGSRSIVVVEGDSVQIPEFTVTFNTGNDNDKQTFCDLRYVLERSGYDPLAFCGGQRQLNGNISHTVDTLGSGWNDPVKSFNRLIQLRPDLNQATSENVTWRFSLKPENSSVGHCNAQGFVGFIGGNAMAIDSEIPQWNIKDASLNFVVTSPHFNSKGEVISGAYEMSLKQDVANCLWGVAVTPQNAQFSVFDEAGVQKVAVAVVSISDGMVRFRATGFTFSTAQFKIGLARNFTKRIQCRKGSRRLLMKVGSRRCPSGWKRA